MKTTRILGSLGLSDEPRIIKKVERVGAACTIRVHFHSDRAAKAVLRAADRFFPPNWKSKTGAAAVIGQMNAIKRDVEIFAKNHSVFDREVRVQDGGWMKVPGVIRSRDSAPPASRNDTKKPKYHKW